MPSEDNKHYKIKIIGRPCKGCNGFGVTCDSPHIAMETRQTSTGIAIHTCQTCRGTGMIWRNE